MKQSQDIQHVVEVFGAQNPRIIVSSDELYEMLGLAAFGWFVRRVDISADSNRNDFLRHVQRRLGHWLVLALEIAQVAVVRQREPSLFPTLQKRSCQRKTKEETIHITHNDNLLATVHIVYLHCFWSHPALTISGVTGVVIQLSVLVKQ